jgi:hypothetical protein
MSVVLGRRERKRGRERWSEESERRKGRWIEGCGEEGQRGDAHMERKRRERQRSRIPTQLHTRVTAADAHFSVVSRRTYVTRMRTEA